MSHFNSACAFCVGHGAVLGYLPENICRPRVKRQDAGDGQDLAN